PLGEQSSALTVPARREADGRDYAYSSCAPPRHLPGASTSPPPFRHDGFVRRHRRQPRRWRAAAPGLLEDERTFIEPAALPLVLRRGEDDLRLTTASRS